MRWRAGPSSIRTRISTRAAPPRAHFDEILGYHYYTELAHSAGMPAEQVSAELDPTTRVTNLVEYLDRIDSTVQYSMAVRDCAHLPWIHASSDHPQDHR